MAAVLARSQQIGVAALAVSIASVLLCACGGGLDQPQRFTYDASLRGGVTSAIDAGPAGAPNSAGAAPAGSGSGGNASQAPAIDAAVATPSMVDAGPPPPPPPPTCVTRVFEQRCGDAACHGAGSSKLDLISDGVRERLIDRASLPDLPCMGGVYIATDGSPSLLLDKLQATPSCGARMPPTVVLRKREIACVEKWVYSLGASKLDASELDAGTP